MEGAETLVSYISDWCLSVVVGHGCSLLWKCCHDQQEATVVFLLTRQVRIPVLCQHFHPTLFLRLSSIVYMLVSVFSLNICLDSDPSASELRYNMSTRQSTERSPPVYTRAILDFNFSAAPEGSTDCVVELMLENTGAVPYSWYVCSQP